MAEVRAVSGSNALTVVSTFSGCGGSCLGFEMAGYRVLWASEFVVEARASYALNHPEATLDARDIREVTARQILDACALRVGQLDVFEGSPPCASFSMAGSRDDGWRQERKYSDTHQRVDDLFFEYVRLLRELQPRAFVAENVYGLVKGRAWGYFSTITRAMIACGYRVSAKLLDAQWLGVPQQRERLIFVGVRNDLELEPVFPKPLPYYYSIRDALPNVDALTPTQFTTLHDGPRDFSRMAIGARWRKLKLGEGSKEVFTIIRPDPSKPSPTLLATCANDGAGSVTHPYLPRKFTIDELRALASFPSDFQFTGKYVQQGERIGRAVPPLMMFRVARTLRDAVLGAGARVGREVSL